MNSLWAESNTGEEEEVFEETRSKIPTFSWRPRVRLTVPHGKSGPHDTGEEESLTLCGPVGP